MGVTNADAFRMLFEGLYASELWSWSEDKFIEWLNSDYAGSALPMMNRWSKQAHESFDFNGHSDNYGDRI